MKVLIDTNIIMDYALERADFVDDARKIIRFAYTNKLEAFISASSITDIYYLVQKYKTKSKEQALAFLQKIVSFIGITGVDKTTIISALQSNFNDFEDAVQNFSAVNSGIEIIVTRNSGDFRNSELKVFEPAQFIEYMENRI